MNDDHDDLITYELPVNQPVPPATEDRAAIGELPKGVQLSQEYVAALPIDALEEPKLKWRIRPRALDRLIESIDVHGLINPIVVTPTRPEMGGTPEGGTRYRIVAGRMRYAAFKELGRKHIPALIAQTPSGGPKENFLRVSEQLVRQDLTPLEKGMLLRTLQAETGWPHSRVAKHAGVPYGTYRDLVSVTNLSVLWRQYLEDSPRRLRYGRMVAASDLAADDQNRALTYLQRHIEDSQAPPSDFHLFIGVLKSLHFVPDIIDRDMQSEVREALDVVLAQPVVPTADQLKGAIVKFIPDYRGDFSLEEYLRILDEVDPTLPYRSRVKRTNAEDLEDTMKESPFKEWEDTSLPAFPHLETADESLRAYIAKLLQSDNPDHQRAARVAARLYGEMHTMQLI